MVVGNTDVVYFTHFFFAYIYRTEPVCTFKIEENAFAFPCLRNFYFSLLPCVAQDVYKRQQNVSIGVDEEVTSCLILVGIDIGHRVNNQGLVYRFFIIPVSYTHLDVYKRQWLHEQVATLLSGKEYERFVPRGQYIGSDPFDRWLKPCLLYTSMRM